MKKLQILVDLYNYAVSCNFRLKAKVTALLDRSVRIWGFF